MSLAVVLVSQVPDISQAQLYKLARALEINAKHCATAWGIDPPTIDVVARSAGVPNGVMPMFFVDGSDVENSGLAYHYYDPLRRNPAARVFVGKASGFNIGDSSVSELASHELVEAMVDPYIGKWVMHPSRDGVETAVEVADPTQTHYTVNVNGSPWRMSNFVTKDYYRADLAADPDLLKLFRAQGGRLDWSGEISFPGEIGPHGYATMREHRIIGGWRVWLENSHTQTPEFTGERLEAKSHPLSRTKLRGWSA
jgi:hypothetical protein